MLSVKSTGHDFQGRSTSQDTLNVWVHYMKNVTYFDNWSVCNSEPRKAIQALAGDQWGDLYKVSNASNVDVVGGNAVTVGTTGGYM